MARGFNGTTDRIDYNNIDNTSGQAQTFSAWIYSDDITVGNEYIFDQHLAADAGISVILRANADNQLYFIVNCVDVFLARKSDTSEFSSGEWIHVLVTWDGSLTAANAHIYVGNVEVSYSLTTNGVGAFRAPEGTWSLGGQVNADNANLDGGLAEVGWWNRVLTADERAILTKGYSPRFIPNGLKFAPDLIRNQRDIISGETGTLDGTTVRDHPRVFMPCGVL